MTAPRVAFAGLEGRGEELAERLVAAGLLGAVWDPLPMPASDFACEQMAPLRTPRQPAELWRLASVVCAHLPDAAWAPFIAALAVPGDDGRVVVDCRAGALPTPDEVALLATRGIGLVAVRDNRVAGSPSVATGEPGLAAVLAALGVAPG